MGMLKITGDTYPLRRHLAIYGAKFSYEDKCYLSNHNEEIIDFCIKHELKFENYDKDMVLDEKWEIEQKNLRAKQKAEKYINRAKNYETKGDNEQLGQYERDFLVLAEPVKIGHHSEGRHRKLLERSRRKMDKQHEFYKKSNELEGKAKYREKKVYKTKEDKEIKRELLKIKVNRALELRRNKYKVGDQYIGRHYNGFIEKINNKSVIIKVNNSGGSLKININYSKDFDLYLKMANDEIKKND